MMYIKFTKPNSDDVLQENYPHHYLVSHVIYKTKQKHGRDISIVTVGAKNDAKSEWQPDPNWPTIQVPKRQRKTFFGRYI